MNIKKLISKITTIAILAILVPQNAFATSFSYAQVMLGTNGTSDVVAHTYQFDSETGISATDIITFTLSDFAVNATLDYEDFDIAVATTSCNATPIFTLEKTVANAVATNVWAANYLSPTTFSITAGGSETVAPNTCIQVQVGSTATYGATGTDLITNPVGTGASLITITQSIIGADTVTIAAPIVADGQIEVTATVAPSITMAFTDANISMGAQTPNVLDTDTTNTVTITSNTSGGYSLDYLATALTNQSAQIILPQGSQAALTAEGWGLNVNGGTHTDGIEDGDYDTASQYMALVGTQDTLAISPGGATSDAYIIEVGLYTEATTPAGVYTNTIDFIVYGEF